MRAYEMRSSHDPARREISHVKCLLAALWGYLSQGIHSHKPNLGIKDGGGCAFSSKYMFIPSCVPRLRCAGTETGVVHDIPLSKVDLARLEATSGVTFVLIMPVFA